MGVRWWSDMLANFQGRVLVHVQAAVAGPAANCGRSGGRVTFLVDSVPMTATALWDNRGRDPLNLAGAGSTQPLYLPVMQR